MDMPPGALRFQGPEGGNGALAAAPSHGQFHGQHRDAHGDKEDEIEQHKHAAAVGPGDEGEAPHIADANGAPGAHQKEAQPGSERFSLHREYASFHFRFSSGSLISIGFAFSAPARYTGAEKPALRSIPPTGGKGKGKFRILTPQAGSRGGYRASGWRGADSRTSRTGPIPPAGPP